MIIAMNNDLENITISRVYCESPVSGGTDSEWILNIFVYDAQPMPDKQLYVTC